MSLDDMWRSVEAAYRDWGAHLGNPNYCRVGNELTWQNREKVWLRDEFDYNSYLKLCESRQYSLVAADDGGLIQLFYKFSNGGDQLMSASASFYGKSTETIVSDPNLIDIPRDLDLDGEGGSSEDFPEEGDLSASLIDDNHEALGYGEGGIDMVVPSALVSFIPSMRIDFTPSSRRSFVHESCHLHIPGFPLARIPVGAFPTPEQFIELVFAWFYPQIYEERFSSSLLDADQYRLSRVAIQRARWLRWDTAVSHAVLPHLHFSHAVP